MPLPFFSRGRKEKACAHCFRHKLKCLFQAHRPDGREDARGITPSAYMADATVIEMSKTWKQQLRDGYPKWSKLPYEPRDGILYSMPTMEHDTEKPCSPITCLQDVLQTVLDHAGHPGFARTIENLQGKAILRLTIMATEYIKYCAPWLERRTPHHKPYGALQQYLNHPSPSTP
ncbi:hypothetical protein IFM47457_04964 [Aspergillus lentulus]|nr:hypothetical protein IFM47457_04964 [Aspergillus lentulus]